MIDVTNKITIKENIVSELVTKKVLKVRYILYIQRELPKKDRTLDQGQPYF